MIGSGRYDQIPRKNRLCPSCRSNEIEDETHFLFNCPKYSIQRDEFYNKVQFYVHNIKQLPPLKLMVMQIKLLVVVRHFPVCPEHQNSETETETLFYLFITSKCRLTLFHCFNFRPMPYGQLAWRVSYTQQ